MCKGNISLNALTSPGTLRQAKVYSRACGGKLKERNSDTDIPQTFTNSKSAKETLEKNVKYVQS